MNFKKIQKHICFPGKLTFQKMYCSGVQTIYDLNLCECCTVVYHRTTDVKGRSSNPPSGDLFF